MEDFFYWMGVVFSGIFSFIGFCLFMGLMADYCWAKMQNVYGLMEIMNSYKKYNKEKQQKDSHQGEK